MLFSILTLLSCALAVISAPVDNPLELETTFVDRNNATQTSLIGTRPASDFIWINFAPTPDIRINIVGSVDTKNDNLLSVQLTAPGGQKFGEIHQKLSMKTTPSVQASLGWAVFYGGTVTFTLEPNGVTLSFTGVWGTETNVDAAQFYPATSGAQVPATSR